VNRDIDLIIWILSNSITF